MKFATLVALFASVEAIRIRSTQDTEGDSFPTAADIISRCDQDADGELTKVEGRACLSAARDGEIQHIKNKFNTISEFINANADEFNADNSNGGLNAVELQAAMDKFQSEHHA